MTNYYKEDINIEEAKKLIKGLKNAGLTEADAKSFMVDSYNLISESFFKGEKTLAGAIGVTAGFGILSFGFLALPALLAYLVHKSWAKKDFVAKIARYYGDEEALKLEQAIDAYLINKKDANAIAVIRENNLRLAKIIKKQEDDEAILHYQLQKRGLKIVPK